MQTVEVDLTEDDCEMLMEEVAQEGFSVEWTFQTNTGEDIIIKFVKNKDNE